MFGLMRRAPRLPYCGTCKTIGVRYGQRSRMLLNHDIVFLAELRMHSQQPQWERAFRSFNCLAKPKEIPAALDYAAAVTVLLAHYRVADHADDSGKWYWRAVARLLSPSFRKASGHLRALDFPLDELNALLRTQAAREKNPQSLADLAEPTAAATAMVFSHGGFEHLYRTGHRFGYLIYVLDAYEDRERDARSGDFNALAAFPQIDARGEILKTVDEIELPAELHQRLHQNVEERLGLRPRVLCCVSRQTIRERWREAVAHARRMRERERTGIAVLGVVALIALLFPHHARGAASWREAVTLPFNLMALGSFFATPAGKSPVKRLCGDSCGGCCDSCDCDDCSCCDCGCCCDGCDCS